MTRLTECHFTHRDGWLGTAVFSAINGIASTAIMIVGVAVPEAKSSSVMVAGVAGLV